MNYLLNGLGAGSGQAMTLAQTLLANNMDHNILRPYEAEDGRSYVNVWNAATKSYVPQLSNNNATLRKDEWIHVDKAIVKAAMPRLALINDLRSSGLTYNIPNAMGKTSLETEVMGDISAAAISMDPVRQSQEDRPEFNLTNLPLPVIHKDFSYSMRQIAVSRNGGSPLDTTTAELAARKVAEQAEALALGITGTYSYGGGSIYGLTNFPSRLTKVLTNPTATGWTPATLVSQILAMKEQARVALHYGPFKLYLSPAWDVVLDADYSASKGDNTLRERIEKIKGIGSVVTLDYLTGYQAILVQQTTDIIREVIGMDITTLQWETHGGLMQHFKVMAIMVPQLRADINGRTGIVHGVAP